MKTISVSHIISEIEKSNFQFDYLLEIIDVTHLNYFKVNPNNISRPLEYIKQLSDLDLDSLGSVDFPKIEDVVASYSVGYEDKTWDQVEAELYKILNKAGICERTLSVTNAKEEHTKHLVACLNKELLFDTKKDKRDFSLICDDDHLIQIQIIDHNFEIELTKLKDRVYSIPIRIFCDNLPIELNYYGQQEKILFDKKCEGSNLYIEIGLTNKIQFGLDGDYVTTGIQIN